MFLVFLQQKNHTFKIDLFKNLITLLRVNKKKSLPDDDHNILTSINVRDVNYIIFIEISLMTSLFKKPYKPLF